MSARLSAAASILLGAVLCALPVRSQPGPDCDFYLSLLESGSASDAAVVWAETKHLCELDHDTWLASPPSGEERELARAEVSLRWAEQLVERDGDCLGALTVLGDVARRFETLPERLAPRLLEASRAAFLCAPVAAADTPVLGAEGLRFEGVSGGPHAAGTFGMPCAGYVGERPNHVFEVSTPQTVNLLARATEAGDPTLVLTGPGGTWCNDDAYGFNPAVSARLEPGRYAVFVGESEAEESARYELLVTTEALPALSFGSHRYGEVVFPLGRDMDAVELRGTSEGEVDASVLGAGCVGRIASVPDVQVALDDDARLSLEVTPGGTDDLTLVLVGTEAVLCNDDVVDRNPAVSSWLRPGRYDLWVGHKGPLPADYLLRLSEDDLFGVEPGVLTPGFGTGTLNPGGRRSVQLAGVATGEEEAERRFGPDCAGFITFEPNHTLYVERDALVWIDAGPGSSTPPGHAGVGFETGDLTLIVTGSSGTYCSDDARGRDPGLAVPLEAGTYDVYVGERALTPSGTSYGLRASLDEPAGPIEPPAPTLALSPGDPVWHGWGLGFGEDAAAEHFGASCPGAVPETPPWRLTLSAVADVHVEASAGLLGDLVLVLNGTDGALCSEAGGATTSVDSTLPPGTYDLYVGELYGSALGTPYALTVSAGLAGAAPTPLPPPLSSGETVAIEVAPTVGLATASGVSGGAVPARLFGPTCVGHVPERAQVSVDIAEPGRYRMAIIASGDTTLVVDGPGGPWCNDDGEDYNPVVEAELAAGRYLVSVGSYSPHMQHEFVLWVSRAADGGP